MLNPVYYNIQLDVTPIPLDVGRILYIYRNVIWASHYLLTKFKLHHYMCAVMAKIKVDFRVF